MLSLLFLLLLLLLLLFLLLLVVVMVVELKWLYYNYHIIIVSLLSFFSQSSSLSILYLVGPSLRHCGCWECSFNWVLKLFVSFPCQVTTNHQETESILQKKPYTVKKTHKRRKRKAHRHSPTSFQTTTLHRRHVRPIPVELIDRLPRALAEINRKLVVQNSMWSGLWCNETYTI